MPIKLDEHLAAKIEPFDSFWEAPENIEKGYMSFGKFYKRNYLKHIQLNKNDNILVISCGTGYFVNLMTQEGYKNILGIDSDMEKVKYAQNKGLNCKTENAFPFLEKNRKCFDMIFAEQEINHLTKEEILKFLKLCWNNLNKDGMLVVHSLNGANPITGSEASAQNFNHFNMFTEYSLRQVMRFSKFKNIRVIPLNLYVFYENPINYIGLFLDKLLNLIFMLSFVFYGKKNRIFTKKIASIARKQDDPFQNGTRF
jgi:SAM-dependent methyltransferase